MAFLGADVVKVEEPKGGDCRAHGPCRRQGRRTARSSSSSTPTNAALTLNLKTEEGKRLSKEVAKQCRRASSKISGPARWTGSGLGWDVLRDLNPRLIYATIKGFGAAMAPISGFKSYEPVAQAMGGAMSVTGFPENLTDPDPAGYRRQRHRYGTWRSARCWAIQQGHQTGRGQHVEVSMQDLAVVNIIRVSLRDHQRQGRPMERHGNQLGHTVPGTTYACAGGGLERLCAGLRAAADVEGDVRRDWRRPSWPMTRASRPPTVRAGDNRDELNAIVEGWTRRYPTHEVMRRLGDAGVPCGACQDTGEVLTDPHLKAREMIVDSRKYLTRGTYQTVGCPIKIVRTLPAEITCPPLLGEHTAELLGAAVQASPLDEVARMKRDGGRMTGILAFAPGSAFFLPPGNPTIEPRS